MTREALARELERMAAEMPANVSLLWQGLEEETPWASFEAEKRMVSASTVKLPMLMAVLNSTTAGERSLDSRLTVTAGDILPDSALFEQGPGQYSLEELLRFMIIDSDNSCTNRMIRLMGMGQLNAYFARMGLTETKVERCMLDYDAVAAGKNNYTSARDQFRAWKLLLSGEALPRPLAEFALSALKDCRDTSLLLRYLMKNPPVAHKTGMLENLNHDSAVFFPEGGQPFFLGVFVSNAPSNNAAERFIGTVGKKVWTWVNA